MRKALLQQFGAGAAFTLGGVLVGAFLLAEGRLLESPRDEWIIPVLFIAVGLCVLVWVRRLHVLEVALSRSGARTDGRVDYLRLGRNQLIRYTFRDLRHNTEYTGKSRLNAAWGEDIKHAVGDEVAVFYDPADPTRNALASDVLATRSSILN